MTHVSCCIVQVHVACVRFAREVSHMSCMKLALYHFMPCMSGT